MVPDLHRKLSNSERFAVLMELDRRSTTDQREEFYQSVKALKYEDFLRTDYWGTVRDYVVDCYGGRCGECRSARAAEVHHRSYCHHGKEHLHLEDLLPVCKSCHGDLQAKFDNSPAPEITNRIARIFSSYGALLELSKIANRFESGHARGDRRGPALAAEDRRL